MTVRHRIGYSIIRDFFPYTVSIFSIAVVNGIEIDLAKVVEERNYSDSFLGILHSVDIFDTLTSQIILKAMININAVLNETTLISSVKSCTAWGGKEIGFVFQKVKEFISAFAA